MQRPKKDGLEYFPLDVTAGIDDEIELLEAEYGLEGFAIFIKLLQKIYKNNYYLDWTEKEQLQFSKRVNVDNSRINSIINSCLKWGLLEKTLYDEYKILTSRGIQKRFLLAIGRRTAYEFYKEYLLLSKSEVIAYKNLVYVAKTPNNVHINPQSKSESEIESKIEIESSSTEQEQTPAAAIQHRLENCYGRLISPYELETLSSYLDNNIQLELIERAITESADSDAMNLKYIKKILNRCLEQKIFTLERYELDQQEFKNKNKAPSSKGGPAAKPNKFTTMATHGFDFEALEKLEDAYIDEKVKELRGESSEKENKT